MQILASIELQGEFDIVDYCTLRVTLKDAALSTQSRRTFRELAALPAVSLPQVQQNALIRGPSSNLTVTYLSDKLRISRDKELDILRLYVKFQGE